MVLRKKLLEEVRAFIGTDVVKVFTGVRRCGKSVLMGQVRDLIVNEIDPRRQGVIFRTCMAQFC